MIKEFKLNKNGKIEFTKEELKELLDNTFLEGYNSNMTFTWTSPLVYSTPRWIYKPCTTTASNIIKYESPSLSSMTISADEINTTLSTFSSTGD